MRDEPSSVRERLALARRILELTRQQQEAAAGLPGAEAIGRFLALVEERQACMDRFDRLQEDRAPAAAAGAAEAPAAVQAEIQALLREAARIDAANMAALQAQRDAVRAEIERLRLGREALLRYGQHGPAVHAAFIDKKK